MNHINVAYATMSDYYYICVSMVSIIQSAAKDTFLDFAVLGGEDFTPELQAEMLSIMDKYPRHKITFYDVSDFDWMDSHADFIAKATYYRLALPLLLDSDRCLYLDGDTLVCEDLWELYNWEMGDNFVAGVRACGYYPFEWRPIADRPDLPDKRSYINAGVMLMNLGQMREENLTDRLFELMAENLRDQDQDTMNAACYGRVSFLPFRYNTMTKYAQTVFRGYYGHFEPEELVRAWTDPAIIHYADRNKPWNMPSTAFGEKWWSVCRSDKSLWEYFYHKAGKFYFYQQHEMKDLSPFIESHDKVYCYGAGDFGNRLAAYCRESGLPLAGYIVSDGQSLPAGADLPVFRLSEIANDAENVGIILAMRESSRQGIMTSLERFGQDNVIGFCDNFFLELPVWTYTASCLNTCKQWQDDDRPAVCFFMPDAMNGDSLAGLINWLEHWEQRDEIKPIVITRDRGPANDELCRQGIFNLAAPYGLVAGSRRPEDLRDNAGVAKMLSDILAEKWNTVLAVSCGEHLDIGQRIGDIIGMGHVFVNPNDGASMTVADASLAAWWEKQRIEALAALREKNLAEMDPGQKYIVFGKGDVGGECYHFLQGIGLGGKIECFFDNGAQEGEKFYGVEVCQPAKEKMAYDIRVIVATRNYTAEIVEQLLGMGLRPCVDIITFQDFKLELQEKLLAEETGQKRWSRAVLFNSYERKVRSHLLQKEVNDRLSCKKIDITQGTVAKNLGPAVDVYCPKDKVYLVDLTVRSILIQNPRPKEVRVWLEEGNTTYKDYEAMRDFVDKFKAFGVRLYFKERISLCRLLAERLNSECLVVAEAGYAYPQGWFAELLRSYARQSDCVIAIDARTKDSRPVFAWKWAEPNSPASFSLIPYVAHGVIYPPALLEAGIINRNLGSRIQDEREAWEVAATAGLKTCTAMHHVRIINLDVLSESYGVNNLLYCQE